jgi:hypothetical protein
LKVFFEKAKKLAPTLASIISPLAASATSTAPPPAVEEPAPPSTVGKEFTMPFAATEQYAEVA